MQSKPKQFSPRYPARAFTLIEIIVVVAIIALLATMIVPRLTGNEKRAFKLAVDQVGDFLTMYAQRQTLGQKVVGIGIGRGGDSNSLMLMEIDAGASAGPNGRWRIDPTVKPVPIPYFMHELDIFVDGDHYDATQWPLSCQVGQERPIIQIDLRGAGETASLTLYPYGVSPIMVSSYGSLGTMRATIDLDSTGQSRTDW